MRVLTLDEIRPRIDDDAVIDAMRDALIAQSRGECDTPMPMHLDILGSEVHVKSSYRRGGKYFALKMASTFHGIGSGMILLCDAANGKPLVYLDDAGHLTDVRTAAVAAMTARELGRTDRSIGILGSGIQARLTARFHARVLPLEQVFLWGRNPERAAACAAGIRSALPNLKVEILDSPAAVARATKLIVTCTATRDPLLHAADLQPATHISAVGSDSPGKWELNPDILRHADLVLADSLAQCEKLGELQHAPAMRPFAIEIGTFLAQHLDKISAARSSVADFTGLGIEDLYIAELIHANGNV